MQQFLQRIRTHFNVIHKDDFLSLTLINPNLDLDIINEIKDTFRLQHHIKKQQIIIIESVNFDDQLLQALADGLPQSLQQLSLDFTGCQSLRGDSFPHLFQRLSLMNLKKLKLDLCEVCDVNDIVIQGLTLLLQSLEDLEQLYLDLYEDGYLLLAQSLSSLSKLRKLHLDLSANQNLTEDNLQLFFTNIAPQNLTAFEFRILDIEHIGGGSFFKLGETMSRMKNLQVLGLTISTFSNLNHKGVYSILKQITYLQKLKEVSLNLSDTQLPQKMLSFLSLPSYVDSLYLDVSYILSLIKNVKYLSKFTLNLDFCPKITDDSLQQIVQVFLKNHKSIQLCLPDRQYSSQLIRFIIKKSLQCQTFTKFQGAQIKKQIQEQWNDYQQSLSKKRNSLCAGAGTVTQVQKSDQDQQKIDENQNSTEKPTVN